MTPIKNNILKILSTALVLTLVSQAPAANSSKRENRRPNKRTPISRDHNDYNIYEEVETVISIREFRRARTTIKVGKNEVIVGLRIEGSIPDSYSRSNPINTLNRICYQNNQSNSGRSNCIPLGSFNKEIDFTPRRPSKEIDINTEANNLTLYFVNQQIDSSDYQRAETKIKIIAYVEVKNRHKDDRDDSTDRDAVTNLHRLSFPPEGKTYIIHLKGNPSNRPKQRDRYKQLIMKLGTTREGDIRNPISIDQTQIVDVRDDKFYRMPFFDKRILGLRNADRKASGINLKIQHTHPKDFWMTRLKIRAHSLGRGNARLIVKAVPVVKP